MRFYMPTKIYSEENCIRNHGAELAALGTKALIVTGRNSSVRNGSLQELKQVLTELDTPYAVFNQIEENPSIETVMTARDFGLAEDADFVIGLGGGSPMDAAKAISLMMKHRDCDASYLYTKGDDSAYPVAAIPTTCGTGSEATPYAILTIHKEQTKRSISHLIFPALALSDGRYLASAPMSVLISTTVDALGHFIESYINTNATDYSRMLCREGMRIWAKSKDILTGQRTAGQQDYANMMNASTVAGMAISHTGTSLPHGLSYYLTYECGVPHGKAVGVFLPGYLDGTRETVKDEVLELLGFASIQEFRAYLTALLGPVEIDAVLKEKAVAGIAHNQAKLANCPYEVDVDKLAWMFP